jgi:CRP/FNR family transcriptional regulator, cyclic AMP receptor protein
MRLRKNAKVELIKSVPLFASCTKKELEAIAGQADELTVPAGKALTKEGERGREFMVIVDGSAEVRKKGRRLNLLGSGDFLGEIALISGGPRTATVTTTSEADILVLTDRAFSQLTKKMPSIQTNVLKALSERLEADAL